MINKVVLICFLSWLMPMGIFIKPSQEKIACDGQRAICMCHHEKKVEATASSAMDAGFSYSTGAHKESAQTGGATGPYFINLDANLLILSQWSYFNPQLALSDFNPFLPSIEAVPKP